MVVVECERVKEGSFCAARYHICHRDPPEHAAPVSIWERAFLFCLQTGLARKLARLRRISELARGEERKGARTYSLVDTGIW